MQAGQAALAQAARVEERCGVCSALGCQEHGQLHPRFLLPMFTYHIPQARLIPPSAQTAGKETTVSSGRDHLCAEVVFCLVKLLSCEEKLPELHPLACMLLRCALGRGHLN